MNCKNSAKKAKAINQISGVSQADIEKAKNRMFFFMGLMNKVLEDQDFIHFRGQKYACVENLLMIEGRFFEFPQEKIKATNPSIKSLDLSLQNNYGYCEGFVLPWKAVSQYFMLGR